LSFTTIHLKTIANYSEHELLQLLSAGNKDVFEFIYKKNFASIYHFAKRFVADEQGAEDITTEVFIKLWERFKDFNSLPAIKSFLFTSTRNACINYNRSDQRADKRHKEFAYLLTHGSEAAIEEQQIPGTVFQYIYDEIAQLPVQEKRVFTMAFIEGLTNDQIAARMDINNQSVRNYKAKALKTLRINLQGKDVFTYMIFLALFYRLN
jgi:RNA polymerase sigma-70 factor (ECF subfamily)